MSLKPQSVKNFLVDEIARQRKNLFLWSPVFVGGGIITFFKTELAIAMPMLAILMMVLTILVLVAIRYYRHTGQTLWLFLLLTISAIALYFAGYSVASIRALSVQTSMLAEDIKPIDITGTIEKLVYLDGAKAKRVILKDVPINGTDYRVRLKTYHFKGDGWHIGDRIKVRAKLMAPSGPVMPDGFDYSFKAYYDRIGAVGYTLSDAELIEKSPKNTNHVQEIRNIIGQSIYDSMEPRHAAVAQALLTGERAGMNKDDAESFRTSGLAHLLAISGLHIGLVAGCVFFFVRLFLACIPDMALYYPIKKWAACCAIIIAFGYMILAGATVPTVRAFIMTSLVLLAIILDRSVMNLRLVALAALFVMVTTPEAVIGPSFTLSFTAVTALIVFYRDIGRQWLTTANAYKPHLRPFFYIFGIIVTSLVATAATTPFSILFFNRFAVYSVLSNVLAMPLMAFIVMPVGLLSVFLIPINLDSHFWVIMEWGIEQILEISRTISAYEHAAIYMPSMGVSETILICFGFVWFMLWRGVLRFLGLFVMVISLFMPHSMSTKAVLISEKMDAILVVDKQEDKLFLLGKMNGYLKQNWLGFYGYSQDVDIFNYQDGDIIDPSLGFCDDLICRLKVYGTNLTVLINPLNLAKACQDTDILIATIPIQDWTCPGVKIIDRFDVWRDGATSITFDKEGYEIKTVNKHD